MKKNDISYVNEELNTKFNFRVALLCTSNNKILLQKSKNDNFYSLIGGRVNLNEDTKTAIIRETKEETGIDLSKDELKLIKVIENFFTYNNIKFHELLFIYKVTNQQDLIKINNFHTLDKENVINKWYSLNELSTLDIRPSIIKECYNDTSLSNELIIE